MVSNWPHQTDVNRYITACNTNRKEDVSIPYFHSKDYKKISVGLSLYLYENCLKTNINKLDFGRRVGEGAWRRERGGVSEGHAHGKTNKWSTTHVQPLETSAWTLVEVSRSMLDARRACEYRQVIFCWSPQPQQTLEYRSQIIDKCYSIGHQSLRKLWNIGQEL